MAFEDVVAARNFDEAVLYRNDLDEAMTYAHPDVTIREAPGLPYRGTYTGRAGLEQLMTDVGGYWEFLGELDCVFFGTEGPYAVNRISGRAKVIATGEEVDFLCTEWFTIRDGKVADIEVYYWDQAPLLRGGESQGHLPKNG